MVAPTPFERMLAEATQQAQVDPVSAFRNLDNLYGKSLTDLDVRRLGAFAAHLGGSGLGDWENTSSFLHKCLGHPALESGGDTEHSLWRALHVIYACAGNDEAAQDAFGRGVRNEVERGRLEILKAQTMIARGRIGPAAQFLEEAARVVARENDEELQGQIAQIAINIGRAVENGLIDTRNTLLAANTAAVAAVRKRDNWDELHKVLYSQGRGLTLAGRPAEALLVVQEMMKLERRNKAGPELSFYSAALACRAQITRGQFKIAGGALKACKDMAGKVADEQQRMAMIKTVETLTTELDRAQSAVAAST